jgi:hypothetical protein
MPERIILNVVEFVTDQDIAPEIKLIEENAVIQASGVIGSRESMKPPAGIVFVRAGPNLQAVPQGFPEVRVDEFAFCLVNEGKAGGYPHHLVGKALLNQLAGQKWQDAFSASRRDVTVDIPDSGSRNDPIYGFFEFRLMFPEHFAVLFYCQCVTIPFDSMTILQMILSVSFSNASALRSASSPASCIFPVKMFSSPR